MSDGELMRKSWNRRAGIDAMHFVHNSRPIGWWGPTDFYKTGEETIRRTLDPFLDAYVSRAKSRTCLEIGCGIGRETVHLAARFRRVIGLDVSDAMLDKARATTELDNVTWVLGDGEMLDVIEDEGVSFVYSGWVFQHIPDPNIQYMYLQEIGRVLRPGGWYFVQLYADLEDYARKKHQWDRRAKSQQLEGWSEAARPEIESGEYTTWMCTAVEGDRVKAVLAESGLSLVHSEGEGRKAWHIGGQKA